MDENLSSARIEALLAHREWARRVALILTADENEASDLEQDLWVEVLDNPPQPRASIRGWLATALRRDMFDRRRSEARRLRRELASARPEAMPSVGDLVAEADAQRRVVQAVVELEEPYRTTVLLRWFEDLKPAEIANRQGIPLDTVRTRLRRAIERLREKFLRDAGGDRTAYLAGLLPLARRAGGSEAAGGSGIAATLGGLLMGTGTKAAVASGAVAVAGLLAWWLVPGEGAGSGPGRRPVAAKHSPVTTDAAARTVRPATADSGATQTSTSAAAPASQAAVGPAGTPGATAPWISLLASQRAVVGRMKAAVLPRQEWSEDATLEARLRVLEKEYGVPISWDPGLPGSFAAAPVPAMFDGASLWYALEYVTAYKGAPLRITRDGVQFVPPESVRGPAVLEHYEDDPFAALALARELIEEDRRFHPRWSGIEDCENTQVRLGAVSPNPTPMDLAGAFANSSKTSFEWRVALNPMSPLPATSGLRSGTALEVVRSWCTGLGKVSVITGRTGIEVWPEGDAARARAADKVAYEGFRAQLERTPCPLPEGKAPLRDVTAALQKDTDARVLLDPAVAGVEIEVGPALSYLAVFESLMADWHPRRGKGVGWTWAHGCMVVTTTRDREESPPSPPAEERTGK